MTHPLKVHGKEITDKNQPSFSVGRRAQAGSHSSSQTNHSQIPNEPSIGPRVGLLSI